MPFQRDVIDAPSNPLGGIVGIPDQAPPSPSAPPRVGTAPTVSSTPSPGQGIALDSSGALPVSIPVSGQELAYVELASTVTITSTTEASPNDILDVTFIANGGPVLVEFETLGLGSPAVASSFTKINLWADGTNLGQIAQITPPTATEMIVPCRVSKRLTTTKGTHTYKFQGWVSSGTGHVYGGVGGAAALMPIRVRVTRV